MHSLAWKLHTGANESSLASTTKNITTFPELNACVRSKIVNNILQENQPFQLKSLNKIHFKGKLWRNKLAYCLLFKFQELCDVKMFDLRPVSEREHVISPSNLTHFKRNQWIVSGAKKNKWRYKTELSTTANVNVTVCKRKARHVTFHKLKPLKRTLLYIQMVNLKHKAEVIHQTLLNARLTSTQK